MNGRNTSDVHTCVANGRFSWDGTFLLEVNHNLVVKLNTSCVQNVVATERGGLGRARPGTDAEDSFFPGAGHTYPHLDEIHETNEDLIGISYTSLIPILIEGVKQLNKNNQEIRTELNQMKEDMKQMKE